ncbi:hypothetical protein HRbin26_01347 [bacterium HR26]|nr:hypothetical protein HRbin26_01347 [bacterium HR26]
MRRDHDDVEVVDRCELLGLGRRCPGHAGQLSVHPEVVLERYGGLGHRLALYPHALLCLDRLVQALAVAATEHLSPGELVDDDHLAVADDVVLVAVEQLLGFERLLQVVHQLRVAVVVEALPLGDAQQPLDPVDARLGERDVPVLEVDGVVHILAELAGDLGELVVAVHCILRRPGDDQRGARLVDQDVVHLVDDGVVQLALDDVLRPVDQVVPQVVEPEFVVRPVGDISQVRLAARDRPPVVEPVVRAGVRIHVAGVVDAGELVGDHTHRDAEEVVDRAHPAAADPREVIVGRHQVAATSLERVEVERQRRNQRLPLAGLHLGDLALVQHDARHELHVEVPHADGSPGRLAHHGEGLVQQVVERLPGRQPLLELVGLGPELLVAQALNVRLQRVNLFDFPAQPLQLSLVRVAEDLGQQASHRCCPPGIVISRGCVGIHASQVYSRRPARGDSANVSRLIGLCAFAACALASPRAGAPGSFSALSPSPRPWPLSPSGRGARDKGR